MNSRTIHPDVFHSRMRAHWESTLGNVYTPRIGEQWTDLARTFNAHIEYATSGTSEKAQYSIVAAPLGTGKTQGLILYCATLTELYGQAAPGSLVVTRLIQDADAIADQINNMVGRKIALAYHHKARQEKGVELGFVPLYPVAIITHAAYRDAMDELKRPGGNSKWPMFSKYEDGERGLVVIDESLDMVEHDHVGVDKLSRALGFIPQRVRCKHPLAIEALEETVAHMREMSSRQKVPGAERPRLYNMVLKSQVINLDPLLAELKCSRLRDCDEDQTADSGEAGPAFRSMAGRRSGACRAKCDAVSRLSVRSLLPSTLRRS